MALSSIDCGSRTDTGYVSGKPFSITVVTVDGKAVERDTANAYYTMAKAADAAGVTIAIVSGFRTMASQTYLYNCYKNCNCNNCNLAARPGYSNHQSGHAVDLNTSAPGVLTWLNKNGATYGFKRTVPSEAWHWEWWGGGPGGGPCGACVPSCKNDTLTGSDCKKSDCAASSSRCVEDKSGARCVAAACPPSGKKSICLSKTSIGLCVDGTVSTGDCASFGAICSSAGASEARCVSAYCVRDEKEPPTDKDVCLPSGQIAHCTAAGEVENARDCPAGKPCALGASGAACGASAVTPDGGTSARDAGVGDSWVVGDGSPGSPGDGGCAIGASGRGLPTPSLVFTLFLLVLFFLGGVMRRRRLEPPGRRLKPPGR